MSSTVLLDLTLMKVSGATWCWSGNIYNILFTLCYELVGGQGMRNNMEVRSFATSPLNVLKSASRQNAIINFKDE